MRFRIVFVTMAILMALSIGGSAAAQEASPTGPTAAAAPCLVGDPFDLAELAEIGRAHV